ncbi:methyl-accepting chemotaxis protein [Acidovorax lacteus]|uniref:Methyl-accepting chemotaxis protein n=1 Tax=Acidovorax lacteus TaxID=1924988 RepID=A0ABP8KYF9_9BURK
MALLSASLCALMVLIGMAGLSGMRDASLALDRVYKDRVVPLKQIKTVSDAYAVYIVDTAHKVRDGALTPQQGLQALANARRDIEQQWAAYIATELVPAEKQLIAQFEQSRMRADAAVAALETLLRSGDKGALAEFTAQAMYPALDPLQDALGGLVQVQLDTAHSEYTGAVDEYRQMWMTIGAGITLALILSAGLGYRVARSIVRQLGTEPATAATLAQSVAHGDLTVAIELRPGDETSVMAQLKRMQQSLVEMVSTVHGSAASVSAASAQIAEGNTDLSARTESQASALEQTAASMEQLNSSVRMNADNARTANQLAQDAFQVADQGGSVVTQVVATMKDIHQRSARIADIIGVIDGIAFQTNILALNAAVEAARAGEQGRGFAVVASEVRSLAQRSAEAAKEIKSLITASVERVEEGSSLVDQAGHTMEQVVQAIGKVNAIMREISSANGEQSQGVDQINEAVTELDQTTQQNAALVEEMAAAAGSLSAQARELLATVESFKLPPQALALQDAALPSGAHTALPQASQRHAVGPGWKALQAPAF